MKAERIVDGIPVNPVLPKNFYSTDNRARPNSPWWYVPYITEGRRGDGSIPFSVECLDGGAWDRPTWWGSFKTIEEAVECAKLGPERRRNNPMFPDPRKVPDPREMFPVAQPGKQFLVRPRAAELGGGFKLVLIEDMQEEGGGVFPASSPAEEVKAKADATACGQAWVDGRPWVEE